MALNNAKAQSEAVMDILKSAAVITDPRLGNQINLLA
jgi:hypothetical protein